MQEGLIAESQQRIEGIATLMDEVSSVVSDELKERVVGVIGETESVLGILIDESIQGQARQEALALLYAYNEKNQDLMALLMKLQAITQCE